MNVVAIEQEDISKWAGSMMAIMKFLSGAADPTRWPYPTVVPVTVWPHEMYEYEQAAPVGTEVGVGVGTDVGTSVGTDVGTEVGTEVGTGVGV